MPKQGRPTKYNKKYCKQLVDFFDREPYIERELEHYDKDGNVKWVDYKRMPNNLPTIRDFAKHINVHVSTVYAWLDKDSNTFQKEFSDAFTQAKDLQKWFLVQNGLQGLYNPAFSIFVAKNISDMTDKQDHQHSGKDGGPIESNASITYYPGPLPDDYFRRQTDNNSQ